MTASVKAGVKPTCLCLPVIMSLISLMRNKIVSYIVSPSSRRNYDDFKHVRISRPLSKDVAHRGESQPNSKPKSKSTLGTIICYEDGESVLGY